MWYVVSMKKMTVKKSGAYYQYTYGKHISPFFTTLDCLIRSAQFMHRKDKKYAIQYTFDEV